jgi:hypothetical protein
LVPVPDDVPEVSFTADPAKSWAILTGEWITAAQTAYGSPPAVSVSLDPYDTLVLALMERRLTNVLRSRGAAVLAGDKFLNLTPQRTETNASFAYLSAGQLADLESVSFTGGDSLLLQEALATIETAVANASGDPDVAALRALVIDLYRMCSALNASDPVAFGPPIDVLRKFVNDPYHELPTAAPGPNLGYRVNTTLTLSELAAAGRAVNAIVAAVAARTTPEFLTLTYEEALDAASADTLARNPSTGIVYRLVDRFGAPFELPEAFTLATGTQFFVNAFTDLPARDGNATLEVIYLTITSIPAIAVQDADGDLLPDNWERYFFGGTGANAFSSDGSGYSALQEYFSGTDPRDAANNPSGAASTFQLSPVTIRTFAGSQLEMRWHWPTAYSAHVAFTIYESTDLSNWSATPYSGFSSGTPDTQRSIFPIPATGPRYYVVGVRLR